MIEPVVVKDDLRRGIRNVQNGQKGDRSLNALSTRLSENFKAFYTPKESGTHGT